MKFYITHIVADKLPHTGFKQISFLTSNSNDYSKNIFYLGYGGSYQLTKEALSSEIAEGKIIRLANPPIVTGEKFVWLDPNGNVFISDDLTSKKDLVENSGLTPYNSSKEIFERTISKRLNRVRIQRKIPIS